MQLCSVGLFLERRPTMLEVEQYMKLPRLLDLDAVS